MGKKLDKEIAVKIVDRLLHGYKTKEIAREFGISRNTIGNYTGYYKKRKAGEEIPASMSISQESADAICEEYGFKKETLKIYEKAEEKQKTEKPEQLPGQMKMELQEERKQEDVPARPVVVWPEDETQAALKKIGDELHQIRTALWTMINKEARTK